MATHSARDENSVQASLSELRRIEQARVAAVKEAKESARRDVAARVAEADRQRRAIELSTKREDEERRHAAEREQEAERLAAAHALALAREREHIAAEARLQERRIDRDRQRLEVERLQALAMGPPRRSRVLLAAVIAVAVAGMALMWQQNEMGSRHAAAAQDRAEAVTESLRHELAAAESAIADARQRTAGLRARLAAFESERQAAASERGARQARGVRPRNRDTRPAAAPRQGPRQASSPPVTRRIDLGSCKDEPLGCMD